MRRPNAMLRGALTFATVAAVLGATACTGGDKTETHTASADPAPSETTVETVKIEDSALGPILTDENGMTLYAFANDKQGGGSTCSGTCIATWPAVISDDKPEVGDGLDAAKLGTIDRDEDNKQVVYNGWPLYGYAGDVGPQDIDGQGVDAMWWAVSPDGTLVKKSAAN